MGNAKNRAKDDAEKDLLLPVFIQPRASRNEVVGRHGDALKIRIAAPPVDGVANVALCRFVAELCKVPLSAVSIDRGQSARRKIVRIRGLAALPADLADAPEQR